MRKELLIIALGLATAGPAAAEVLATPEVPATPAISLPQKGETMAEVQKKFGAPVTKRPTVGGDTPKHPPITRWDYADFYVVFERNKTVDAVVPNKHPTVYHKDQLKPAENSSAAPAAAPAAPAEAPKAAEPAAVPAETAPVVQAPAASTAETPAPAEPAASAPAEMPPPAPPAEPASPSESAPAPAKPASTPPPSSGGAAVANPVPDTPPTPK